jgi:hypothetical protein
MGNDMKILPGQVTQLTTENGWHPSGVAGKERKKVCIEAPPWPNPTGICQVCGERPATEVVHGCPGGMTFECRLCVLRAMVRGAREAAARLVDLERQLAEEESRGSHGG